MSENNTSSFSVQLRWEHVLAASDFDANNNREFLEKNGGVYVWFWSGHGSRVRYIGEAGNFADRFVQHFTQLLGGGYTCFDMQPDDDFVEFLRMHFSGKSIEEIAREDRIYIPDIPFRTPEYFKRAFLDEKWQAIRLRNLISLKFGFAMIESPQSCDDKLRKEIEAALICGVRKSYYQDGPIKLKGSNKPDIPIGNINRYPSHNMSIKHTGAKVELLPHELVKVKGYT